MKEICIIGGGIMGQGMAYRSLQAGHKVYVFARNPEKLRSSKEPIGQWNEHPNLKISNEWADLPMHSDLSILCLTRDEVVWEHFLHSLQKSPKFILDTGTSSPEITKRMFDEANKQNIEFADSPMTGSKLAARDGQILFMFGGEEKQINDLSFFYKNTSKAVVHCGPVGFGQKAKLALNLTQAGLLQVYLEGWELAKHAGISWPTYQTILSQSAAHSALFQFKFSQIQSGDFEPHFSLKNMHKDVEHALHLASEERLSLPLSEGLESIFQKAMDLGLSEEDFASLSKVPKSALS